MLAQSSWRSVRSVLGVRARLFSVLSDAFDVSLNSSSWPQPLRSSSCNTITAKNLNQTVTVSGWVDSIRVMKDSVFVVVRDSEGAVQTLFDCDKDGLALQHGLRVVENVLKKIPLESVVCVQGCVGSSLPCCFLGSKSPQGCGQFEDDHGRDRNQGDQVLPPESFFFASLSRMFSSCTEW